MVLLKINRKNYTKRQILERVGDIKQIGGIRQFEYIDGVSKGIRGISLNNGNGLLINVLPDRGLDIGDAVYKGSSLAWQSPTGETHPLYYNKDGTEWLRTFHGGLLITCGLSNTGDPCVDQGEELGQHGRISNLQAFDICASGDWIGDEFVMNIKGKVREAVVFGCKLELTRSISMTIGDNKILVKDTVENLSFSKSPLMILYHMNLGFPLLDENAVIVEPKDSKIVSWNSHSEDYISKYNKFDIPIPNFVQTVFFHEIPETKDGFSNIGVINENFDNGRGLGIYFKYKKDNLPFLCEWRMTGQGEYALGIEPTNALVDGRCKEREKGNLKFIDSGEKKEYLMEIGVLDGIEEISNYKKVL